MKKELIYVSEALAIILKNTKVLGKERLPLTSALGRVLAEDAISDTFIPPLDNSAMDGYALRSADAKEANARSPAKLKVIGSIYAGQLPGLAVKSGEAIRIMTGAPIPKGVDTVIMVEETKEKDGFVLIYNKSEKGKNIRKKGEDIRKNEKVIARGKTIRPAEIGMLAALGYADVWVTKTPRVGVMATGDELVDIKDKLPFGRIRNSNSYSMAAAVKECGAEPVIMGIVKDKLAKVKSAFLKALSCDVIIISGGVSMGRTDYIRPALEALGAKMKFWKVAQRPGQPFAFGILKKKPVFCLPGNPVSSMMTFEIHVRPAIMKMCGKLARPVRTVQPGGLDSRAGGKEYARHEVTATITDEIRVKPGRRYFMRVIVTSKNGRYYASLTGPQGSGILKSMVLSNGILTIPENITAIRKGERWPIIIV
jgi:molybdopterin molybdotransferase